METPTTPTTETTNKEARIIEMGDLAARVRWRRYWLAQAASNPYLERPAYAA